MKINNSQLVIVWHKKNAQILFTAELCYLLHNNIIYCRIIDVDQCIDSVRKTAEMQQYIFTKFQNKVKDTIAMTERSTKEIIDF